MEVAAPQPSHSGATQSSFSLHVSGTPCTLELDQRFCFVHLFFKIDCNLRKVGYKTIVYGPRIRR